jgi:hypothetical protein
MVKTISITMLCLLLGCSQASTPPDSPSVKESTAISDQPEIVVGGLYATKNEDGSYGVMKVLAVDDFAVHLRTYANRFKELPTDIDPATLSLGSISGNGGFGIGHFPLAKEGFWRDQPEFLKETPVAENELEGYRIYLEAMQEPEK